VFDHAPNPMAVLGPDDQLLEGNTALCEVAGHTLGSLRHRRFFDLVHREDVAAVRAQVRRLRDGEVPTLQIEVRVVPRQGQDRWVVLSASLVRDARDEPVHVVVELFDIAQRKRWEELLQWQAERDSLTGLWNRRRFDAELVRRKKLHERHGEVTAVILVDLDDFKSVNDTHGHRGGDEVLRQVGSVLSSSVRAPDLASRYGGDEFAVILPHTTGHEAARLAERLLATLARQPIVVDGQRITVTGTAGVSDNASGADLVTAADVDLYAAKHARPATHHPAPR
jgi:diguanylate cyclase (GGDEF)-like protein/PAS domain S-box-containing protein